MLHSIKLSAEILPMQILQCTCIVPYLIQKDSSPTQVFSLGRDQEQVKNSWVWHIAIHEITSFKCSKQ